MDNRLFLAAVKVNRTMYGLRVQDRRLTFFTGRSLRLLSSVILMMMFCLAMSNHECHSADLSRLWPQWRGPLRDGQAAPSPTWPQQLDESNLRPKWRVELGPGYSGPIVSSDRVFVTETRDKKSEVVQALSREDGSLLWTAQWPGAMSVPFFASANGDWIRATPTFDGQSLFIGGMRDVLVCVDAETGSERWRVDFVERFKTSLPSFGFVSSPLVDGDHVYVQAGASFFKLSKDTGDVVWRTLQDNGGMMDSAFSSPVKATIGGRSQLIVQTREQLAGVDDETGRELWSQAIPAFRGMNILTPVVFEEGIFTSSYGGKSLMLELNLRDGTDTQPGYSAAQRWENKAQAYMSTPVVVDGHLYLHLRNQRFTCIDLSTGKEKWTTQAFGKYWSLIAQGRRILALDERGDLLLIQANPEKFDLLGTVHISDNSSWAHLAICDNEIFIRDLNGITAYDWSESSQVGEKAR